MDDAENRICRTFGGTTFFPDDMAFLAYMFERDWSLGIDEGIEGYVSYDERGLARQNGAGGRGSVYIYDLGFPDGPMQGIDYESEKFQHNVGISVINASKERNQLWVKEIIDILEYNRRAGLADKDRLNGWDFLKVGPKKKVGGYTNFYGTTIEVSFHQTVKKLPYDGFANEPRKDFLRKQKGKRQGTG